jgi:hypothetical protein
MCWITWMSSIVAMCVSANRCSLPNARWIIGHRCVPFFYENQPIASAYFVDKQQYLPLCTIVNMANAHDSYSIDQHRYHYHRKVQAYDVVRLHCIRMATMTNIDDEFKWQWSIGIDLLWSWMYALDRANLAYYWC